MLISMCISTVMALQKVFPLSLTHTKLWGHHGGCARLAVIFCRVWAVTVEMSLRVLASSSARCQDSLGMRVEQFALICQVLSQCFGLWQLGKKIKHGEGIIDYILTATYNRPENTMAAWQFCFAFCLLRKERKSEMSLISQLFLLDKN